MRLSRGSGWAAVCMMLVGCGGTVQDSGTTDGTGGGAAQGGSSGGGGTGGHTGLPPSGGAAGVAGGGVAGSGGTFPDGGAYCYGNEACAPDQWCNLEPAAPGVCASGGKAGVCVPRPTLADCPLYDQCPNACGCNGKWYCGPCEAHVEGVSTTADNAWCMDGGTVVSCGGFGGAECPPDMFCKYPASDPCGGADSQGVCLPRPMCPDPGGSGACGCDGQYYLSECSAQASGTDVTGGKECVDGGAVKSCGGKKGLPCASDEWCDYAEGNCGSWDNTGSCKKKPSGCPEDCPGVCACNAEFYCNECEAHASGFDDAPGITSCLPQQDGGSGQYSAEAWSGGLDHVFIRKADWDRNVCLTIHLASPHQPSAFLSTPDGWGLVSASISDHAADCSGSTPANAFVAQTVQGAIVFGVGDGGYMPCTVDVHATLVFTSGPPWANPNELMNADGVVVQGGCW